MNPSRPAIGRLAAGVGTLLLVLAAGSATAQLATNGLALPTPPALPSAAPSMLRVLGALMLVIGLFIGGAFLFTRTRQFGFNRGVTPRLKVLESRSLGGRHALFVVAYETETLLVSSSPAGISLLTHLPAPAQPDAPPASSFTNTLAQKLRAPRPAKEGGA